MLLNGSDSLADIALQNGFADQSHFTKNVSSCDRHNPGELETSLSELRPIIRQLTSRMKEMKLKAISLAVNR